MLKYSKFMLAISKVGLFLNVFNVILNIYVHKLGFAVVGSLLVLLALYCIEYWKNKIKEEKTNAISQERS